MTTYRNIQSFSLLFVAVILLTGCLGGIRGNGNVVTEDREVSYFDEIEVNGAFEVFIREGKAPGLQIEADENLHEVIDSEVSGKRLEIQSTKSIRKAEALKLYITYTKLEKISLSGAVDLTSKSLVYTDNLEIEASGAAAMDLEIDVAKLDINVSGGSEMDLRGYARDVDLDISGAGELEALELETENFDISISGAGDAEVYATKTLNVSVSGAGSVEYKGDPEVSQSISGAGSVNKY